jgi:tRNA G37 N-methylase TrmD
MGTATRFCNANGMNPTISIKESLISNGRYLLQITEIPALNLIDAAKRALYKIIVVK